MAGAKRLDVLRRVRNAPAQRSSAGADPPREPRVLQGLRWHEGGQRGDLCHHRVAGLEHVEILWLVSLEGELDLLMEHLELAHQPLGVPLELVEDRREVLLERDAGATPLRQALLLAQREGLDQPAHDVVALGLHHEVAVEADLRRVDERIARERHAGARTLVQVAEDHALNDHGGAPLLGDLKLAAVDACAGRVPGAEHELHAEQQLTIRIVDDLHPLLREEAPIAEGDVAHLVGGNLELLAHTQALLGVAHQGVEWSAREVVTHAPELQEAAVGVPRSPGASRPRRQARGNLLVDTDIEESVEHARHADGGARAHREQQRLAPVPEAQTRQALETRDLLLQRGRDLAL